MSKSKRANRYGSLAERWAAEEYGLRREGVHTSWRDAVDRDGNSVEIKAALVMRDYPRFRIFKKYHERLQADGGYYVFVAYKRRGNGISVIRSTRLHSTKLSHSNWYGAGGHRDSEQVKIPLDVVF